MKKREILIISALSIFFTFLLIKQKYSPIDHERYTPTEFLDNKAAKKELKEKRKEWMENMHRTAPGDNWKEGIFTILLFTRKCLWFTS